MTTRLRVSIRTGILGVWTVMVGSVGVLLADRLVSVVDDAAATPLVTAGVPLASSGTGVLAGLYSGGSVSVFVGLLLVLVGWHQVLAAA
ncbi:MAG: hypothetical protein ACOCSF_00845 [Halanaeroarchaeum sp.]